MSMQITEDIAATRTAVAAARAQGHRIGLVPTMGALHAGHAGLLRAARRDTGFVVASLFVNPTQFGPKEDLSRYPRPFAQDVQVCTAEGVDLLFQPAPATMYPPGFRTYVEVQDFQDVLCGASRPGHFRGVTTIVLKLFNIVQPDIAYFGQKDAQQARILQQMVRDLNLPLHIEVCPIVREPDGLALSSRNQYLDATQRRHAVVLSQSLEAIRRRIIAGERDAAALLRSATDMIQATPGARLDYAAAVDYETLQPLQQLHGRALIALAVAFGTTRLIDNLLLDIP
jgi:pantoate--beta-alanine ligase